MKTKTEEIFQLSAPFSNPYQGDAFRALFVCSAGLLRSATAANLFAKKDWNTRGCGTEDFALIRLSVNLIMWANKVYFMNRENYESAKWTFREQKEILKVLEEKKVVLNIEDSFPYNHPELLRQLEEQVK